VIGSINIDLLGRVERIGRRDEEVDVKNLTLAPGGHAGNCATALALLGTQVRLVGSIGNDVLGRLARDALKDVQVDVDFLEHVDNRATGLVFIPVLPDGDKTLYFARGANEALSIPQLEKAASECTTVIIFDPPCALFSRLAEVARARIGVFAPGGLVFKTPVEKLTPLLDAVRYLVVNGPESRVLGGVDSPRQAALSLAQRWDLSAVVTIGAQGCWIANPDGHAWHCPSFEVDVVDATGAGDAFVAGLCAALAEGRQPLAAIRTGCAIGALATRALGAQASLPLGAEVEELLSHHQPKLGSAESPRVIPDHPKPSSQKPLPTFSLGADGWRGIIGEGFSPVSVVNLVTSIAFNLHARMGKGAVLVAHDARYQSEQCARQAAAVLDSLGLRSVFAGTLPTPVTNFIVSKQGFLGAVLITASHNPFYWNGVKLKVAPGMPPGADLEAAIEHRRSVGILNAGQIVEAQVLDSAPILRDFTTALLAQVDVRLIRRANLHVVIDGLHGIAGTLLGQVLREAGCQVNVIGGDADPFFCGMVPDPMRAQSRMRLSKAVRDCGADLGMLTDGDGDRLGVLDCNGDFIWPHDVLALLVKLGDRFDPTPGAIATTVATGSVVRRVCRNLGRDVVETRVGFKHIAPLLRSNRVMMGGGGVGDVGFRLHGCDRDPFLAALMLLQTMAEEGQPLQTLIARLHATHGRTVYRETAFRGIDVSADSIEARGLHALDVAGFAREDITIGHVDGTKIYLNDTEWLLLRASTTERVIRAYAEMSSPEKMSALLAAIAEEFTGRLK
jgi:phosphomannomutase/sugar/nucleoside kinase (ribokinase family)